MHNPNFPDELLKEGLSIEDRRNLTDNYKYWRTEAIKADLDTKRHPFAAVLENFAYDFNIATAVRNANAFLASDVFVCGKRKWDKRGAVGTHKYQHVHYYQGWSDLSKKLKEEGFEIVVFDNIPEAKNIFDFKWPEKPAMVFGAESVGVSSDALDAADHVIYIPQFGSTRSLNVGTASGIAMYDWAQKNSR
jgi:tRNA G18 (ribose-2'-O)-methylase SpoU